MAAVAGRTAEARSVTVTTTSASAALTAPAGTFEEEDAGRTISGTGIPGAASIASVTSPTAATLSANATAAGTVPASLGAGTSSAYGFTGWSPLSDAESESYTIAGGASATAPDRLTDPNTPVAHRWRS